MFFPIYESTKNFCRRRKYPKWQEYILATFVAGGVCNFFTNPIWVVRTRIMVQALHEADHHYKSTTSITKIMAQMVREVPPFLRRKESAVSSRGCPPP